MNIKQIKGKSFDGKQFYLIKVNNAGYSSASGLILELEDGKKFEKIWNLMQISAPIKKIERKKIEYVNKRLVLTMSGEDFDGDLTLEEYLQIKDELSDYETEEILDDPKLIESYGKIKNLRVSHDQKEVFENVEFETVELPSSADGADYKYIFPLWTLSEKEIDNPMCRYVPNIRGVFRDILAKVAPNESLIADNYPKKLESFTCPEHSVEEFKFFKYKNNYINITNEDERVLNRRSFIGSISELISHHKNVEKIIKKIIEIHVEEPKEVGKITAKELLEDAHSILSKVRSIDSKVSTRFNYSNSIKRINDFIEKLENIQKSS